jgi:hypothetical protein
MRYAQRFKDILMGKKPKDEMILTQEELEGEIPPSDSDDKPVTEPTEEIINDKDQDKSDKKSEKPKEEEKPEIISAKYECSFAPMGESNTRLIHKYEGEEYTYDIKMKNKIYELPEDLLKPGKNETEEKEKASIRKRTREALLANGFEDVTVITSKKTLDIKTGKYIYRAIHPEQSPKNRINCTISLALIGDDNRPMFHKSGPNAGKQIYEEVHVIEGIAQTEDKLVYQGLIDAGFVELEKIEKEE